MKKKICFLGILFIFLVPFTKVFADDDPQLSISCGNGKVNETIECTVSVSGLTLTDASFSGTLTIPSEFTVDSVGNGLSLDENGTNLSASSVNDGIIGKISGKFNKTGTDYKIKVSGSISKGDESISGLEAESEKIEISEESTSGTSENSGKIKTLKINDKNNDGTASCVNVSPGEDRTVCSYTIDTDTFLITIEAMDSGDSIKIEKEDRVIIPASDYDNVEFVPKSDGRMLIYITVGSREYAVNINKDTSSSGGETDYEADSSLESLIIGGVTVDLSTCTKGEETTNNSWTCNVSIITSLNSYIIKALLKDSDNFMFDEEDSLYKENGKEEEFNGNDGIFIKIVPKDSSKGYKSSEYIIFVESEAPEESDKPSSTPTTPSTPEYNPGTGSTSIFIITILLIISFGVSVYIYKKNVADYNNNN